MPARKKPHSLEDYVLRSIGGIVKIACRKITDAEISNEGNGYVEYKRNIFRDLQTLLFNDSAHYFHRSLIKEFVIALSELQYAYDILELDESENDIRTKRRNYDVRSKQLDIVQILCHPAVKEINISKEFLGHRWKLHWRLVCRLSTRFIDMSNLESLNLGHWSCKKYSLLAEHNQEEGEFLRFLPKLTHITVSDVSNNFFQSVGKYSPNLICLKVHSSDIGDRVISWLSKCRKLQYVELYDNRNVSPVGFAQMLRSNPELKSLGRCECLGSVLSYIFNESSIYRRSVINVPECLNLIEIDCSEKISLCQLLYLVQHCPKVSKLRIKYCPDEYFYDLRLEECPHLSTLIGLGFLTEVRLIDANFYSHLFFRFVEIQGQQLTRLELTSVDELNLNAVVAIGQHCSNLKTLHFTCCYFQLSVADNLLVEELTSFKNREPFGKLKNLSFLLLSPNHLCVVQYCVSFARGLKRLIFDQYHYDVEERFVESLFDWNPLVDLEHFEMGSGGGKLTVHSANLVIQNCSNLKFIGRLSHWGKVSQEQIKTIKKEVKDRNFDLIIDLDD